eukprot:TRINITY_DN6265_c0_g1_i1.p2 TRINITY_DN6265_c0_g1~~TRINITY_DN6265_c0_g1_i1.p2  ORF type:complete len:158 (+),score=42.37 TRINITY_DN6265_c0_g1_i1:36-476(+)
MTGPFWLVVLFFLDQSATLEFCAINFLPEVGEREREREGEEKVEESRNLAKQIRTCFLSFHWRSCWMGILILISENFGGEMTSFLWEKRVLDLNLDLLFDFSNYDGCCCNVLGKSFLLEEGMSDKVFDIQVNIFFFGNEEEILFFV